MSNSYFNLQEEYWEDVAGDGGSKMYFPSEKINIEECINSAYKVISKRKGQMKNGTFVKSL